ncbi:thioredoxin domain-containing protein [Nanchangia anserum]|uniref:Thioredoxin domain-containing protein n=1 Tax=Nanchangia anserum TaxID=2692125 RepID=A0A8I0GCS3_9ACTO|nr:thioredoxin domain-containing protein [Nanchangia anserum]MBD3689621.1 thioredoxin domain-containing protein [Nanchangia anserum]QOX81804.1 thioredoxin domain-containing protein [Nanchangia anserum]
MAASASSRRIVLAVLALVVVVCVAVAVVSLVRSSNSASDTPTAASDTTTTPAAPSQAAARQSGAAAQAIASITRNDPADPRARGDINAPVVMIELSDYSCPMCAAYYAKVMPRLEPLIDDGTLRIEFHDMPIFDSPYNSTIGALGGIAAGEQGKFWEYLDRAEQRSLSDHPTWTPELALEIAREAGVPDVDAFRRKLNDADALAQLHTDLATFQSWGITGTPAFFINDRYIMGAQDPQVFLDTIEAAKNDKR